MKHKINKKSKSNLSKKSKSNLSLKIIITVLIVFVIAGIWVIKKLQTRAASEKIDNPVFALNVTEPLNLEQLKSYGLPIIIDFGSDACIPCKQMAPILKELNEKLQGKAVILFVDIKKYPAFANGFPIIVIPTQIFIDAEGKPYNPKEPDALHMILYSSNMKLYSPNSTGEHTFTTHEGTMTKDDLLTILEEMGMQ